MTEVNISAVDNLIIQRNNLTIFKCRTIYGVPTLFNELETKCINMYNLHTSLDIEKK